MAVPLSNLQPAREFNARLKIIRKDSTYLRMVDATHLVWDPTTARRDIRQIFCLIIHLLTYDLLFSITL